MQSIVRHLNETYEATPGSVAHARADMAAFAVAAGAAARQVDGVRLAVSEALTNCVVHAYSGRPGAIHVDAAAVSGELLVLISDDGCGLAPEANRPGMGLGLGLIAQVADDFAIVSRASGGTEVRIRFRLSDGDASAPASPAKSGGRSVGELGRTGFTPSMSAA
jgi:anti-sigma regulatory factor (Ser/Thr protein kinase)